MMNKYKDWISKQSQSFIKEIHPKLNIPNIFKDENYRAITLKELKELDKKFINNPEGDINGDTTNG